MERGVYFLAEKIKNPYFPYSSYYKCDGTEKNGTKYSFRVVKNTLILILSRWHDIILERIYLMGREIYILEYYEEKNKQDLHYDKYSLLGVFKTEKEAEEKKHYIIKEWSLAEDSLYVSATRIAKTQWEGGFISV